MGGWLAGWRLRRGSVAGFWCSVVPSSLGGLPYCKMLFADIPGGQPLESSTIAREDTACEQVARELSGGYTTHLGAIESK